MTRQIWDRIHQHDVVTGKDTKVDITTELIIEFINKEEIRELFTDFIWTKLDEDLIK